MTASSIGHVESTVKSQLRRQPLQVAVRWLAGAGRGFRRRPKLDIIETIPQRQPEVWVAAAADQGRAGICSARWRHDTIRTEQVAMHYAEFKLKLPAWMKDFLAAADTIFASVEERMRLVIELSGLNIAYGTGGPFGAGIFEADSGRLLAAGVNLVTCLNSSVLHAEMVAVVMAQQSLGHYDLGASGLPKYELVASTAPCAMCVGVVSWSGVRRLVCGAREEDARRIGFDEGPKASDWVQLLTVRGISVVQDVCRPEAVAVLRRYSQTGGIIYNARQGSPS